jgi:anoctamin-10
VRRLAIGEEDVLLIITEHEQAIEEFQTLIDDLRSAGLKTLTTPGPGKSLLVLVKAPENVLGAEVHRSRYVFHPTMWNQSDVLDRVKDWLFGVIQRQPEFSEDAVIKSDTETESLRSMFHLVTWNKTLGGAGITPEYGKWKHVKAVYPLHNRVSTRALLIKWSRQLILRQDDLDDIRGLFGEKVGLVRTSVCESCSS